MARRSFLCCQKLFEILPLAEAMYTRLEVNNPLTPSATYYIESTDSTMSGVLALMTEYGLQGAVLCAGHQKKGRGRIEERSWYDQSGSSLLLTVALPSSMLSFPLQEIPLRTGLALCRLLEKRFGLDVRIKWPNDLLIRSRKVSGILCEVRAGHVLVGIGLNCLQQTFPLKARGKFPPTSLLAEGCSVTDPIELVEPLLEELSAGFHDTHWSRELDARLFGLGQHVIFSPGEVDTPPIEGVLSGIEPDGALRITDTKNTSTYYSGEILTYRGEE